jgi:hypothetical protein
LLVVRAWPPLGRILFGFLRRKIVRRIFVLSAVFLMVLAAGPAAWADTSRRRGDISQKVGGARNDQATADFSRLRRGMASGWGQFKGITRPAPGTTST